MSRPSSLSRQWRPGTKVTCKHQVEAYYSGYNGNPEWWFEPGMVGTVVSVAPKVRILAKPPEHDGLDEFLVVDYVDTDGELRRTSLNFCNVVRL